MKFLQPPGWARPKGYSNGVVCAGRMIFVAGQVGWDKNEVFQSHDLVDQVRQALSNIVAILAEAGSRPEDIVRMNWYLGDTAEYNARLKEIGAVYKELIGKHFPAMTALGVAGFVEHGAKVEIEVTAMLRDLRRGKAARWRTPTATLSSTSPAGRRCSKAKPIRRRTAASASSAAPISLPITAACWSGAVAAP